ncbi:Microcystin-dependent protein [Clostridium cavendishii DSM 21758]|uniref:Microcystin-dependent protein n=1 Tax=Clostridium cavendishii DSM 21758 TaxID=1121302 RepID=A0A1M6T5E4_9CLOT|nr:tail fiber protein [Clostridium cavendishii]SHK52164.1 Microcystin-dependent protein [Clostridium cavendishii DSM 21758]
MEAFIGTILPWAGTYAPQDWLFCDGRQMQISTNSALYAVIGTTYGGDGRNYFNLPDLRGRVMIGGGRNQASNRDWILGQAKNGNMQTTITNSNMPAHNHAITNTVTPNSETTIPVSLDIGIPVNTSPSNTTTTNVPSNNNCTLGVSKTAPPQNSSVNMYTTSEPTPNATLRPFNITKNINIPATTVNSSCANTGSGTPINIQPDSLCLNFIICVSGLFPPRP